MGITLRRGRGDYVIDSLRVEVLPPGSRVVQSKNENPFAARHPDAKKRLERTGLAAADADFVIRFDGTDDNGARLPVGDYPVVYWLASSARPGGPCDGPPAAAYGVLTTISWKG